MAEKSTGEVNLYKSKPIMKVRVNPQLNPDGSENLSIIPKAVHLKGLRPKTLQEQVEAFTRDRGRIPDNMIYDEFVNDDDFHDYLDDLQDWGLSEHEASEILSQREDAKIQRFGYSEDVEATPLPDPSTEPPTDQKTG